MVSLVLFPNFIPFFIGMNFLDGPHKSLATGAIFHFSQVGKWPYDDVWTTKNRVKKGGRLHYVRRTDFPKRDHKSCHDKSNFLDDDYFLVIFRIRTINLGREAHYYSNAGKLFEHAILTRKLSCPYSSK